MSAGVLARLRGRATWLRYTYPFQLAHGPLCDRYRRDTVRFGQVHLCRSCLALYATLAVGTGLLLWLRPDPRVLTWMLAGLGPVVLCLSWPPLYRRLARLVRDGTRAGAGLLAALVLAALVSGAWWEGSIAAVVLIAFYTVFARQRRAHRVHLCDGCPELDQEGVCSGYAAQADRIRAYEDAMTERLAPVIARELAAAAEKRKGVERIHAAPLPESAPERKPA